MAFPVSLEGTIEAVKECSATQQHPLGTRLVLNDGRVFHYAKNAAVELAVGKLCCSPALEGDEEVDMPPDAAVTTAANSATIIATMSTAAATIAKNRFADGYMYVNTGTGAGQVVKLASAYGSTGNDAGGSSTGATVAVYFDDGEFLSVALDTSSSKVGLCQNPYSDVVVCPTYAAYATTNRPAGVPLCTVTASYYFWLQTWGPVPILMGATPVEGELVMQGGTTTGAVGELTVRGVATSSAALGPKLDLPQIGIVMAGDADAEYALVFLMIAP